MGTIRTHADGYKYQKTGEGQWKQVRAEGSRTKESKAPNEKFSEHDEGAANELHLYADNDGDLYRQMIKPITDNLTKRIKNGSYDPDLADKAFFNAMKVAAKKYEKEFGDKFGNAEIFAAARTMRKYFETENDISEKKTEKKPKEVTGLREYDDPEYRKKMNKKYEELIKDPKEIERNKQYYQPETNKDHDKKTEKSIDRIKKAATYFEKSLNGGHHG